MNVEAETLGGLFVIWLILAVPTIVYLAGRKTDTRGLTTAWGLISCLVPFIGIFFILGLLLKDDRPGY